MSPMRIYYEICCGQQQPLSTERELAKSKNTQSTNKCRRWFIKPQFDHASALHSHVLIARCTFYIIIFFSFFAGSWQRNDRVSITIIFADRDRPKHSCSMPAETHKLQICFNNVCLYGFAVCVLCQCLWFHLLICVCSHSALLDVGRLCDVHCSRWRNTAIMRISFASAIRWSSLYNFCFYSLWSR